MKNFIHGYSIGPLLYCPAYNKNIVNSILNKKFDKGFSLALCLEDTIREDQVESAEQQLIKTIKTLRSYINNNSYVPKIFIRVRNAKQINKIVTLFENNLDLITGFIAPKFSINNADDYIKNIKLLNEKFDETTYFLPILESVELLDQRTRIQTLYTLKEKLDKIHNFVLNIRVGGNDLCNQFGIRRNLTQTIYDIKPITNILSDILTTFSIDYVVSAPVFEYYKGSDWEEQFKKEIELDKLNGFIGKTIIHPNQIKPFLQCMKVKKTDYDDAFQILNWDKNLKGLVSTNTNGERMNELNTHLKWAKNIKTLSEIYGIK